MSLRKERLREEAAVREIEEARDKCIRDRMLEVRHRKPWFMTHAAFWQLVVDISSASFVDGALFENSKGE